MHLTELTTVPEVGPEKDGGHKPAKKLYSFEVFMSFVDASGGADAVLSKDCYDMWVNSRNNPPKEPEESFRRALTAHLCGLDGRRPFPREVEANILKIIRQKKVWQCFALTGCPIGIKGFRNLGYHESMDLSKEIDGDFVPGRKRRRKRGECKMIKKKWLQKNCVFAHSSLFARLPKCDNEYVSVRGLLKWKQPYPLQLSINTTHNLGALDNIEIPGDVLAQLHDEDMEQFSTAMQDPVMMEKIRRTNQQLWRICVVMTIVESQLDKLLTKSDTETGGIFDDFFDLLFNIVDKKITSSVERVLVRIGRDFCENHTLVIYLNANLRKLPQNSPMRERRLTYVKVVLSYVQEFLPEHELSMKQFCQAFDFTPPAFIVDLARCRLALIQNYLQTSAIEQRPYTKCGTIEINGTKLITLPNPLAPAKVANFYSIKSEKQEGEVKETFKELSSEAQIRVLRMCNGSKWTFGEDFADHLEYVRDKYLSCSWMVQKILRVLESIVYVRIDEKNVRVFMEFKNIPMIELCLVSDGQLHEYKDSLSWLPLSRPLIKAYRLFFEEFPRLSLCLEYYLMSGDKLVRKISSPSMDEDYTKLPVQGEFCRLNKSKKCWEVLYSFQGTFLRVE